MMKFGGAIEGLSLHFREGIFVSEVARRKAATTCRIQVCNPQKKAFHTMESKR